MVGTLLPRPQVQVKNRRETQRDAPKAGPWKGGKEMHTRSQHKSTWNTPNLPLKELWVTTSDPSVSCWPLKGVGQMHQTIVNRRDDLFIPFWCPAQMIFFGGKNQQHPKPAPALVMFLCVDFDFSQNHLVIQMQSIHNLTLTRRSGLMSFVFLFLLIPKVSPYCKR